MTLYNILMFGQSLFAMFGQSLCVIFGLLLIYGGFYCIRLYRYAINLPTSKIRSIAMGLVELRGEVKLYHDSVKSPIGQKDCVYCHYVLEGGNPSLVNMPKSGTLISSPFILQDETGDVIVNLEGASVIGNISDTEIHYPKIPAEIQKRFLDFGFTQNSVKKRVRFFENTICVGDKIFLLGTATGNPFLKQGSALKNPEGIMIHQDPYNRVLLIYTKPENKVVSHLLLSSIVMFIAGLIMTIGCLFALIFLSGF